MMIARLNETLIFLVFDLVFQLTYLIFYKNSKKKSKKSGIIIVQRVAIHGRKTS